VTKQSKALAVVSALALAGVSVMLGATRLGVGVPPDSTVYFDAARNQAEGRGLIVMSGARAELVPLTHYPPLFSSLLALAVSRGASVESAARWLNAILFGLNIFLVGLAVSFWAGDSFWLPVWGAFLMLSAPDVLANHSVAMTEPLYLAMTFGGLLCLGGYLQNQRQRFLFAAAVLIALSSLTRYVGVTGIVTGIVALLLVRTKVDGEPRLGFSLSDLFVRRKFVDAVIFGATASLPIFCWWIRNRLATGGAGGAADRQLAFHPIKVQNVVSGFSTVAQWLALGKIRLDFRLAGFIVEFLLLVSLAIYMMKRGTRGEGIDAVARPILPQILIVFIIVYVGILVFTITFFEADNVLDGRSLLPVHAALVVLAPWIGSLLYGRLPHSSSLRTVFVLIALLLVGSYALRGTRWLTAAQADAQGYAGRAWKGSPSIALMRNLPAGIPIYSNGVDAIYYLTGKHAHNIPEKIIHGTGRPNPRYEAELVEMGDDMRSHHGVLVYFETLPERWFLPAESELNSRLPLKEMTRLSDGSVYELQNRER